jgi:hypothetical protein
LFSGVADGLNLKYYRLEVLPLPFD